MEKTFKTIIVLDVFCFILLFLVSIISQYYEVDESAQISSLEIISIILILIYFYIMYLLYTFKLLGKTLYVPFYCFYFGLLFALPEQSTNYSNNMIYVMEHLGSVLAGIIFTFIYFTDIKLKFGN